VVTPARLDAIQSVRALLARRGLPFIEPLQAKSGSRWIEVGGHLAEVERHVEGEDMDRSHTLMIGMTVLARVHSELGRSSLGPAANIAPTANHVDARVARLATARAAAIIKSWARSEADAAVARSAELLAEELWRAEAPFVDRVGRQLVHGDFWDNNVKFSGDDVAGILDLDFMGERPRIDDLALTLYYAHASSLGTHGEAGVFQAMAELRRLRFRGESTIGPR
jgi:Ser/Thr protein kinase RdoA (MazF antagonist)